MDVDHLSAPKPHSLIKTDNKDSVKYFFLKLLESNGNKTNAKPQLIVIFLLEWDCFLSET